MTIEATLCAILYNSQILLLKKSTGRFGEGKWNGAGGKLRSGENPIEGVIREVYEETGLKIKQPKHHGILKHYFGDRSKPAWVVHIFSAKEFLGKLMEGEEGILKWFPIEEIPYTEMWEDDRHWLPLLLDDKIFDGDFYFNKEATELHDYKLNVKD